MSIQAIKPLTSFRFFAAFGVFLSHLSYLQTVADTKDIYETFFAEGFIGVTFFFVLSGFILTLNYYQKLTTFTYEGIREFFVARIARIYPVHVLTFCISLPLVTSESVSGNVSYVLKALVNLFLLQSFIPVVTTYFSYNMPSWSLSDEMFFYLLLPVSLYVIHRNTFFRKTTAFLCSGIFLWAMMIMVATGVSDQPFDLKRWVVYIFPLTRFVDFSLGVFAGLVFCKTLTKPRCDQQMVFTFFEILSLLGFGAALYYSSAVDIGYRGSVYYLPFFVLIIYVFAFQKGLLSKLLSAQGFVMLGEFSFSFYMFHQLVLRYAEKMLFYKVYPLATAVGCCLITVALSSVVYYYYELPMRRKIREKFVFYVK